MNCLNVKTLCQRILTVPATGSNSWIQAIRTRADCHPDHFADTFHICYLSTCKLHTGGEERALRSKRDWRKNVCPLILYVFVRASRSQCKFKLCVWWKLHVAQMKMIDTHSTFNFVKFLKTPDEISRIWLRLRNLLVMQKANKK